MSGAVHQAVLARIQALFDVPVMQNNLRGLYAEHLVGELLGNDWASVGGDWAAWDLEHLDGTRLEVKQSALAQSWAAPTHGSAKPSFSIRKPKVIWTGAVRAIVEKRPADIYVFAWHGVAKGDADQREGRQWQFFVASAELLPEQQSIGLGALRRLTIQTDAANLERVVDNLRVGRLKS